MVSRGYYVDLLSQKGLQVGSSQDPNPKMTELVGYPGVLTGRGHRMSLGKEDRIQELDAGSFRIWRLRRRV